MARVSQEMMNKARINSSRYKKQLNLMLKKGSPLQFVMTVLEEYESSNTLTDADLVKLDRFLRKKELTDQEYSDMVGLFEGKCVFSAYHANRVNPNDKTTRTLQEHGILVTFANIDDVYCYVDKYHKANPPQSIRVMTFDSIIEQAESLKTLAIIGWHVGDDCDKGRMSLYYDGDKEEFHRGCIILHKTPEEIARFIALSNK